LMLQLDYYEQGKADGIAYQLELNSKALKDYADLQERYQSDLIEAEAIGYGKGLIDGSELVPEMDYWLLLMTFPVKIADDLFNVELFPNVKIGYIALIFIVFGLMAFFVALKGKKS
jgi:hypothetical protein